MSLSPVVIGLTGSIGTGKSAVATLLEHEGAHIIDADKLAREVVAPGSDGLSAVISAFGPDCLLSDGSLDRKKLGAVVFSDPQKREQLEEILHPRIRELFLRRLSLAKALTPSPQLIVYAVPLLFESRYSYDELDVIVVVAATREHCIERIMARDGSTREFAEKKLSSQLPIEEKSARADFVIDNNGTEEELGKNVKSFLDWIHTQKGET